MTNTTFANKADKSRIDQAYDAAKAIAEKNKRRDAIENRWGKMDGQSLLKLVHQNKWQDVLSVITQSNMAAFERNEGSDVALSANWALHEEITDHIAGLSIDDVTPELIDFMSEYYSHAFKLDDVEMLSDPKFLRHKILGISTDSYQDTFYPPYVFEAIAKAAGQRTPLGNHLAMLLAPLMVEHDMDKKPMLTWHVEEIQKQLTELLTSGTDLSDKAVSAVLANLIKTFEQSEYDLKISPEQFDALVTFDGFSSLKKLISHGLYRPSKEEVLKAINWISHAPRSNEQEATETAVDLLRSIDKVDINFTAEILSRIGPMADMQGSEQVLFHLLNECRLPNTPKTRIGFYLRNKVSASAVRTEVADSLIDFGNDDILAFAVTKGVSQIPVERIDSLFPSEKAEGSFPQTILRLVRQGYVLTPEQFRKAIQQAKSEPVSHSITSIVPSDIGLNKTASPWSQILYNQAKNPQAYVPSPDEIAKMPSAAVAELPNRLLAQRILTR